MLTHRNLHHPVVLLEVLKAQAALLLLRHISVGVARVGLLRRNLLILHSLHDAEVDPNDGLGLLIEHLVVVELTVVVQSVGFAGLAAPAFPLSEEEADDLDEEDDEEEDDGPGDED